MSTQKPIAEEVVPHLDPGQGLTEQLVASPDGRRLRAITAGEGDGPLVVFEAGMSAPAASWVHTQRQISERTRTLSYDRAGYGGSDPDPQDRTLERLVDDLTGLLDCLGETQPVVLVGHSWGGPIIRLFSERHPGRVGGLVFVDATIAEVISERNARLTARSFAITSLIARLGGKNLIKKLVLPHGASPEITEADLAIMLRDYACAPAMRAGRREAAQMISALPTVRRLEAAGTPHVPTICLQAGRIERFMTKLRPRFNQAVTDLMAAVPDGRVIVVEEAGHLLPQESPAAVRDAIVEVVDAVSEGES
jgi:pimeloyl-ACP methyl ester carboxylesterase